MSGTHDIQIHELNQIGDGCEVVATSEKSYAYPFSVPARAKASADPDVPQM